MLDEILAEIEKAQGPMTVGDLAARLGAEEGALAGMLEFLERKGRLSVYRPGDCAGDLTDCEACVFCRGCASGKERE